MPFLYSLWFTFQDRVLLPTFLFFYDFVCRYLEHLVVNGLNNITDGTLLINTPDGAYALPSRPLPPKLTRSGTELKDPFATLTVRRPIFWIRAGAFGDLGFGEAYMYGDVECDDLISFFALLLLNGECLAKLDTPVARLGRLSCNLIAPGLANSLPNARYNIAAHYNISNEMFAAFLSGDMTYSCAIFPELDADLYSESTEELQEVMGKRKAEVRTVEKRTDGRDGVGQVNAEREESRELGNGEQKVDEKKCTQKVDGLDDVDEQEEDEDEDGMELFEAQMRKVRHIMERAVIRPGNRVLEIGTGWGALAICIALCVPGTTVDTLTLSEAQAELARERVLQAGLGPRICGRCARRERKEEAVKEKEEVPAMRSKSEGGAKLGNGWMRRAGGFGVVGPAGDGLAEGDVGDEGLGGEGQAGCMCREARVRVHLMDYRAMPEEWRGAFDRVVSVEMVEAVGREYLETYWKQIDWALKEDTGVGVVQGITLPKRGLTRTYAIRISSGIFPGGFLPTLTLLLSTLERGSHGRLVVESVENIGPHYARTLREWRRRFEDRFEEAIVPALKKEYPDVMGEGVDGASEAIEVFKRKWVYYFCYCEVGFASRSLGDHIVTFTREGNIEFGCQVTTR